MKNAKGRTAKWLWGGRGLSQWHLELLAPKQPGPQDEYGPVFHNPPQVVMLSDISYIKQGWTSTSCYTIEEEEEDQV